MRRHVWGILPVLLLFAACGSRKAPAPAHSETVNANWENVLRVSQTTATLQAVVSPLMRRGSPVHDRIFENLHALECDDVRYVPWLPYPKLAVAELRLPAAGQTFWDFSLLDPMTEDFMNAVSGHSVIMNFSVIPQWMFKTPQPVSYPADPYQITWKYQQGTEFRDPSLKEVAGYYARLVGWYTQGGFTDEAGRRHNSGHHYKIDYWEVLNEIDLEHQLNPQTYTQVYDAIVGAIAKVDPHIKFVGLALASISRPDYFEYFLSHRAHKPGIPLDMISYHFYALQQPGENIHGQQYDFFAQADGFLTAVSYIDDMRERLSPQTRTAIDEVGAIANDDMHQDEPGHVANSVPAEYWNLSAALYAYLYGNVCRLGINVLGASALAQPPGFFPSVTMVDWKTGQPNPRYWALKLIRENFGPGDRVVSTSVKSPSTILPEIYAQGFITPSGQRKLLLVNKRRVPIQIAVPGASGGDLMAIDQQSGSHAATSTHLRTDNMTLGGFAVAVLSLPKS